MPHLENTDYEEEEEEEEEKEKLKRETSDVSQLGQNENRNTA